MKAKYSAGTRVRLRARDARGMVLDPRFQVYENLTGEILTSMAAVGYMVQPWTKEAVPDESPTRIVYFYTVHLKEEITLEYVSEDYLEIFEES